jgi:hypothetical protein
MAEIAAVSAALFAAMSQKNDQNGGAPQRDKQSQASAWKRTARSEGVATNDV